MSFTNGVSARDNGKNILRNISNRKKNSIKAAKILGFKWIKNLDYPDNQLDGVNIINLVREIENIKNIIKPEIVYTHSFSDLNIDHRVIAEATLTAFRPKPLENMTDLILFEVPSATDYSNIKFKKSFSPNLFIDIKIFWKKKLGALKAYKGEILKKPHSRSIDGIHNLAKLRGNQIGIDLAESFEIIRKVYKN